MREVPPGHDLCGPETHHWQVCDRCRVKHHVGSMTTVPEIKRFIFEHLHCDYLKGIRLEPTEGYPSPHASRKYAVVTYG